MTRELDRWRSLEELEGVRWGEATFPSYLAKRCHRLRTKPLGELTVEDLRIMIGQEIGLRHLVPMAIEVLTREPLAEGDFYPGDLLKSVLSVPPSFWEENACLREQLASALRAGRSLPEGLRAIVGDFLVDARGV
ncbi:hypothetical protein HY251_03460 [bacterium]|nr:hypothetical protein [bacterium]